MESLAQDQAETKQTLHPTNRLADKIKLRSAYITGQGMLLTLCRKMAIPYETARNWHEAERWGRRKAAYDARQLAKLDCDEQQQFKPQLEAKPSLTQQQLDLVNEALLSCDDADEMLKLARAKQTLEECLWVEKHGAKPGTQRPGRSTRQTRPVLPEPVPCGLEPTTGSVLAQEQTTTGPQSSECNG